MPKRKVFESTDKENKVSRILKVQELIDFFVLGEIQEKPKYVRELDEAMVKKLSNIGVNVSYMSRRIDFLSKEGYVERFWEHEDKRYNHYCKITPAGITYFNMLLTGVPDKVKLALKFYQSLDHYIKSSFGSVNPHE
jgi:DNA-binding PadR family transcriptional regulator